MHRGIHPLHLGICLTVLLLFAGCMGLGDAPEAMGTDATGSDEVNWYTDDVQWDTSGPYSNLLKSGDHDVLPVERLDFQSHDGTEIAIAVWRPDVPENQTVPVIMDAGPYYGILTSIQGEPTELGIETLSVREESFFLENFVESGYAYARMAIRGTAESQGCMEFFGENEQQDIDEAITQVATADWSNGNVALYGASYDGTTPWVGAATGNDHLETIVPASGLTDVAELMYRNGTSEHRGLAMHAGLYWGLFGVTDGTLFGGLEDQVCKETAKGALTNPYTATTGERSPPASMSDYWEIRSWREPVKENYDGSILLVHGLQDANVEAHMAYPFVNELAEQGIQVKHMLGQWGHDWPDRTERDDDTVRYDWAEMLYRWFEHELKEEDRYDTGPTAHVQDSRGDWRTEDAWPPEDATWESWNLSGDELTKEPGDQGSAYLLRPDPVLADSPDSPADAAQRELVFQLDHGEDDLRYAGLARLHVQVTPHSPEGGQLEAQLVNGETGETLNQAVMDLRYHAGGSERQQLTPDEPVTARMEFFPADIAVPSGTPLELRITADALDRNPSHANDPIEVHWGEDVSQLHLPIIEREEVEGHYPGQP